MSRSGASSLKEVRLQKEMDKILAEKETIRVELEVPSHSAFKPSFPPPVSRIQLWRHNGVVLTVIWLWLNLLECVLMLLATNLSFFSVGLTNAFCDRVLHADVNGVLFNAYFELLSCQLLLAAASFPLNCAPMLNLHFCACLEWINVLQGDGGKRCDVTERGAAAQTVRATGEREKHCAVRPTGLMCGVLTRA